MLMPPTTALFLSDTFADDVFTVGADAFSALPGCALTVLEIAGSSSNSFSISGVAAVAEMAISLTMLLACLSPRRPLKDGWRK